jgi:hypothetical protein
MVNIIDKAFKPMILQNWAEQVEYN